MGQEARLQERLGYTFSRPELLARALTHRSFSSTNNERLEFLGDAILNFVIAGELFERFDSAHEGQLSRLRARLVRRQTLAIIARDLDLGDCLHMGTGELKTGGFERDSILSDAMEAVIGAVYLDGGLEPARDLLRTLYGEQFETLTLERAQKDPKTRLQEYLQARQANLPEYVVVNVSGASHEQHFVVECHADLLAGPVSGEGGSRRMAEQDAAGKALSELGVDHDPRQV
ncbi:MAG: ribonuclease III [Pseudomonadales bacterium]|nr:ribonuclease III [Pseudomonadales bacterium]